MNIEWSPEKNQNVIDRHGVSFEEILTAILNDRTIGVLRHPNEKKYPNQEILLIWYNEYVYVVPYVVSEKGDIFLKTLYPSRKYTRKYSKGEL